MPGFSQSPAENSAAADNIDDASVTSTNDTQFISQENDHSTNIDTYSFACENLDKVSCTSENTNQVTSTSEDTNYVFSKENIHFDNFSGLVKDPNDKKKKDKVHYCLFCGEPQLKIERHLLSKHNKEPKVFLLDCSDKI